MSETFSVPQAQTFLPSHKPDENWFWGELLKVHASNKSDTPRDIINRPDFPIPHKRAWRMLDKWTSLRIYDYGVTLDLGRITKKGLMVKPREIKP
jgi:hypothetical protein